MPPEPLPWDRKDFFKERKHERSSESIGYVSRWRETPHYGSSSSREFVRWGSADFRSRPLGHGKQGGWHVYSEESGHGFARSRSNEKILDDDSCWSSASRADGKYSRNSKENRESINQKDWKGNYLENGASANGPGRLLDASDQRSVDDNPTYNCHSHSDPLNTWGQLHFNQPDKAGSANGLGTGQRFERENSLGSIDWKPLKWTRSGSLSSRGSGPSGFSHSSSSKSMGVDSVEAKAAEVKLRNVTPVQTPSGDAVACETSAAPSEETSSRKKPRLGWGEGLAKYEKKKVEGPDDGATKHGMVICLNTEPLHSNVSNLSDKSPIVTGLSDCASPATPSSVACSSSPGVVDKSFVKAANTDNDTSNLSGSPKLLSQNHVEGIAFNLENLELTTIANLSASLGELLQSDDPGLVDSSFVRSTAMNKLLIWKGGISKALEITESEIDLLENELKSLVSESGNSGPCPAGSSSLQGECQLKPCEELVTSNVIPRPAPLLLVSSGDMVVEKAGGGLEEERGEAKGDDIDSPGTVTSKFVELFSSPKAAVLSESVKSGESSGDLDASKPTNQEVKCSVYGSNEEKGESLCATKGGQLTAFKSPAPAPGASLLCDREDISHDLILAANKDSASRASEVFNKLLPSDQCHFDMLRTTSFSSWQNDPSIKEKFAMNKRFSRFKERVITLKFRAFQHLWKEDMRLLSLRKYRAKSQKRLELSFRMQHNGYQKHRSSIRSHCFSPAGNLSLIPITEITNFTSRLLSDSQVKRYRNSLKMPALILDKKEKLISKFISSNGLVEDPCAVEKERAMINSWTTEEKDIFMDKLAAFGKDFRKIASFIDHKTTADCVEFYYKNHKSDCFVKTKKKPEFAKHGKSFSANNYLVTSGKRWSHDTNAASLDMLGVASAIAANADDGRENQQNCTIRFLMGATSDYRVPRGDDGTLERSGSLDYERESVAADVLAGICGTLSSEAMSSCITSSFGPGESYSDWKCKKVGALTRRPLTPEVTQNVDDETCSDESGGEMDPADWTDEEKSIFIQAVSSYGKDFTMIARCVRTRSRDQCKVFFSKARKCLGLDMICPRSGNEGMLANDDAGGGGGSDNEDACVVETGSVICNEKGGSKVDEDMMLSDLNTNHCESDPAEAANVQTDLNRFKENNVTGEIICKDPELLSENKVTDDRLTQGKPGVDFDGDGKMGNGVDDMSVTLHAHENAVLPPDTDAGGDEATGEGISLGELLSVKVANSPGLSVSGAKGETIAVGLEPECQHSASEKNLNHKQQKIGDANTSEPSDLNCSDQDFCTARNTSDFAADTNAPVEFGVDAKQEKKIALKLDNPPEPCVISLEQDVSLVNANSVTKVPPAIQYEKTLNPDTPSTLDFEKISDMQCQKSASVDDCEQHESSHSLSECAGDFQVLEEYPLQVSINQEMNGDIGSKKLASLQSISKVDRNFHSDMHALQECFLQKCNSSKVQSSVSELPFLSQEQKSDNPRPSSWSLSNMEKPGRNGDVKLFGQILNHPSSQQKQNTSDVLDNEDKGVQHPKLSSKAFNLKFAGTRSADGNSVLSKLDRNNYPCLENAPTRSYGFWDGNIIQTGFSTLPDSAILLAKYPAAFGNYSSSSSNMEQQPLHSVVKSSERNLNGASVFSTREISSSNGVADYQLYRNRDGARVQPFTVEMKQMQRRNGFEAVSSIQQQGRGMVGLNVGGRGGILVGGACTGVSDPVAAIKMHYARTEQYGGQTVNIIREEESWRGKGDIGR